VANEHALSAFRNRDQFNVVDLARGLKADFILRKDRDFSLREFARRTTYEVEGMRLTLASPEDVLLAKLEWAKLDVAYIERWVDALDLREQWNAARDQA